MLNRDRKEVIDAMIEFLGTESFDQYSREDFKRDTGYQGGLFDSQFKTWANSRYKPYVITKIEKQTLELFSEHYYAIRKDKNGMILLVEKGTHNEFAVPMLKNWFKFINKCEGIWINQLLAESVVVDE